MLYFEIGDTTVPILLLLLDGGVAQTGKTVEAAVWNKQSNTFLDFDDNTFKSSAWVEKWKTLTDMNGTDADLAGFYRYIWDSSSPITVQGEYAFLFKWNDGTNGIITLDDVYFDESESPANIADAVWDETASDHVAAGSTGLELKKVRAALINRQELANGSSSNFVTYDDDNTTPLMTHDVVDKDDAAVSQSTGVPAKRSAPS